jgi:SAM-dependent methyltransferase
MDQNLGSLIGFDAQTYAGREKGHSSAPIRDAVWQLVGNEVSGTVLDAGSGEGGWIKRLQQSQTIGRIISVDLVDSGAKQIEGVEFHLGDLSRSSLPCEESELDWIFALEVLEHLANPRHFAMESHRVLKKGAKLVATTPCNDSLTAKLSFLVRGYFPAFCEHDYQVAGHITPLTELDLQRMAKEFRYSSIRFFYPLPGRLPRLALPWQKLFPFLQGKLWSDSLIAVFTK